MPSPLLQVQELRVDRGGGLGGIGHSRRETILVHLGGRVDLLVVVLLHGDLDDGVVLGVSLLGHPLEVAVRSAAQTLESPEGGVEREKLKDGLQCLPQPRLTSTNNQL